jgi:hypothetical protein
MTKRNPPNFICIGAQRAGTTWFWHNLGKHPDVYLLPLKEIHYFDRAKKYPSRNLPDKVRKRLFEKTLKESFRHFIKARKTEDIIWYLKYLFRKYDDNWYLSLFDYAKEGQISGEITPSYSILEPEDIKKIYNLMPNVKIIYIMRNPIDRAWSHFKNFSLRNKININTYKESEIVEHFNSEASFLRGDYIRTLDNWLSVFPREQFLIAYFDEILNHPKDLIFKIYSFLELDKADVYADKVITNKINSSIEKEIPKQYFKYLSKKYYPIIKELSHRFGSFPANWLRELKDKRL